MNANRQSLLRTLPAVGVIVAGYRERFGESVEDSLLVHLARRRLDSLRREILSGDREAAPTSEVFLEMLHDDLGRWRESSTCRVVNATGIILHSGLGRAVIPPAVLDQFARARTYNLLEVEKENGDRRKRDAFCEELLCELTGAEAAFVVNNNAAATVIILNELARDREVIVSRSQMIEIGGSYRLPDVMEMSGCKLREVGTTNKSYARDYESAINEETGALMLVHTSNYKIIGFTQHIDIEEMIAIGRAHDVPVIDDMGSGSLIDLSPWGVSDTPPVQASVKAGADVICFSGDKLIGGPQAGIIVGKKAWVDRIRKNPLARALRIDKLTCMALESTLKLYFEPKKLFAEIPTLQMLTETADSVAERAKELHSRLGEVLGNLAKVEVVPSTGQLGAGSLPTHEIPTWCVALTECAVRPADLARSLRRRDVSIFPRIKDEQVLFDLRTMRDGDDEILEEALVEILGPESEKKS